MIETYRNWSIDLDWFGGWFGTHPDYDPTPLYADDPPSDNRFVHAATIQMVKLEIDYWYEEN